MTNHGKDNDLSLTHINEQGAVNMVDVGNKPITDREAVSLSLIHI